MRNFLYSLALAYPLASLAVAKFPVITTDFGAVQGAASPFREGVTVYKGIPYTAPPTDSLRWKPPVKPAKWTETLNATELSTLNIWTPTYDTTDPTEIAAKKLPVYFWIFGGRFEGGSGDVITYDGTGLASKDIIVVTMNYRLGAFGFLAHPELSAEFGHDISGNYATGSVTTSYNTKAEAENFRVTFLETMNVSSIAELRKVSMAYLIGEGQLTDLATMKALASLTFGKVHHAGAQISTAMCLFMGGFSTTTEYRSVWSEVFRGNATEFFSLYPATTDTEAVDQSDEVLRNMARVGTWEWAADRAIGSAKNPVYVYYFTKASAEDESGGAYHGAELWYTFNNIPYSDWSNVTWNASD
ncbi:hypothetical protein N7493_011074 [Penicillium malachiteum]|uniref:Carboxylesterase type B domain-containing protein n=1 Tax=Penicillium malachiteum TaxID=1324776 RepID=A0AAD6HBF7_9EURO|nr:hypothetical protein N7493_011074 [Penicillium malachiteum]